MPVDVPGPCQHYEPLRPDLLLPAQTIGLNLAGLFVMQIGSADRRSGGRSRRAAGRVGEMRIYQIDRGRQRVSDAALRARVLGLLRIGDAVAPAQRRPTVAEDVQSEPHIWRPMGLVRARQVQRNTVFATQDDAVPGIVSGRRRYLAVRRDRRDVGRIEMRRIERSRIAPLYIRPWREKKAQTGGYGEARPDLPVVFEIWRDDGVGQVLPVVVVALAE